MNTKTVDEYDMGLTDLRQHDIDTETVSLYARHCNFYICGSRRGFCNDRLKKNITERLIERTCEAGKPVKVLCFEFRASSRFKLVYS